MLKAGVVDDRPGPPPEVVLPEVEPEPPIIRMRVAHGHAKVAVRGEGPVGVVGGGRVDGVGGEAEGVAVHDAVHGGGCRQE